MIVAEEDFFEILSTASSSEIDSVKDMFSDCSEYEEEQELNESGFVSGRNSVPQEADGTLSSNPKYRVHSNLDISFDEDIPYWNGLMNCNRVMFPVLKDETLKKNNTTKIQTLKLENHTLVSGFTVFRDSVDNQKVNNRIGVLICEEIHVSEDARTKELKKKGDVRSSTKKECDSEQDGIQETVKPNAQPENVLYDQQQNTVPNVESSTSEELGNFGQILSTPPENTSLEDLPFSQNIPTQDSFRNYVTKTNNSIIPNLDLEGLCILKDETRQKEIISTIVNIFHHLSKLELEGSKLFLQVKARATWDICSMENDMYVSIFHLPLPHFHKILSTV